jgi:sec-independent protein translocase protein TatB
MLPGVDFTEMLLVAVIAMVVLGPRDLPLMMRKFGRFTGKMRAMAFEFKQGFDELGRQAELEELRKEVANLKKHTGIEELQEDLRKDKLELEQDVAAATAPVRHPAAISSSEAKPTPAYAGLSQEHPGYDNGEGNSIGGDAAEAAAPTTEEPKAGDPHVIPDDEVAPAAEPAPAVKQDTPA